MNQNIAKLTLPHRKIIRVIFPLFWFTKFLLVSIQCLTKILTHGILKLFSVIYFQNMCIVICDFQLNKISALLCILDGFGIAVPVFSY